MFTIMVKKEALGCVTPRPGCHWRSSRKLWATFLHTSVSVLTSPLFLRVPEHLEGLEAEIALARQVIAEFVERAGEQINRLKVEFVENVCDHLEDFDRFRTGLAN